MPKDCWLVQVVPPSPAQPSRGCVADRPGPAAASCRFCLPALLLHLTVGFPSLPLRPAAWKQWEKRELRQVDRRARMSGGKQRIPAALPSVIREKWCLPFFLPFHQRPSVRLGMAEGGEGGDAWAHSGDRAKRGEP